MPVGAQLNDGIVELRTDVAAHTHDHCLAVHHRDTRLKVLDEISCHLLQPGLRAHQLFQGRPLALGFFAAGDVLFILDDFIDLLVERVDLGLIHVKLG
ncbi:hypothetical protein D3C87_919770 [compost metagenome]